FCMVVDKHNNSRFGDDKQVLIASIPEGMGAAEATALVSEALSSDSAKPSNPWMRFVKVDEIEEEGFLLSPSCYLPLVPNWQAVEEVSLMREEVAEKRLIEIRSCDEAIRDIKSYYSNIFSNKK
ncbi:hypothetical protein OAV41_02285, partial [Planctomycetota bacterium]|nr:hypothetical protein [Planctomycetota bacterium]